MHRCGEHRPLSLKSFGMAVTQDDLAALGQVNASVANLANSISVSKTSKADRKFMRDMWESQKNEWYYQTAYMNDLQKELTQDARDYAQSEWDTKNSPEAMVRNLEAAGINPAQFLAGGSSAIGSSDQSLSYPSVQSGSSSGSLPGYSPRYYQDPLLMAQVADLSASADLKRSQADLTEHESAYKDSLTALNGSKQVLTNLQAEGIPFANRMAEVNARIAEALEGTRILTGEAELDKMITQTNLFARQIQELDDKHELHPLHKQELRNQLNIQLASEALLWAREAAVRKGLDLTDAQIALLWEQVYEVASRVDLNDLEFRIKSPLAKWSDQRDPIFQGLYGLSGPIGSVVSTVTAFYEGFQMEHNRYSDDYLPQRNLDRVRRSFSRTRSKYKGR